jgi:hypothetical protein
LLKDTLERSKNFAITKNALQILHKTLKIAQKTGELA